MPEHGLVALEDLVVQAHANTQQILRAVDLCRALRGLDDAVMDRSDTQRQAEQVVQKFQDLAVGSVPDQHDSQREAPHPGLAHPRKRFSQRRRHGLGEGLVDRQAHPLA